MRVMEDRVISCNKDFAIKINVENIRFTTQLQEVSILPCAPVWKGILI